MKKIAITMFLLLILTGCYFRDRDFDDHGTTEEYCKEIATALLKESEINQNFTLKDVSFGFSYDNGYTTFTHTVPDYELVLILEDSTQEIMFMRLIQIAPEDSILPIPGCPMVFSDMLGYAGIDTSYGGDFNISTKKVKELYESTLDKTVVENKYWMTSKQDGDKNTIEFRKHNAQLY